MNIPTTKLPLNALTPHPENYNTHPASQIKELAESLATFGQFKNIVTWTCPENMTTPEGHELHEGLTYILAGHGLWLAAMEAGVDDLEVKDYSGISYGMAISLLLIDNAATLGSEPDVQRLAALLARAREPMADKPRLAEMLERLRLKAGINGHQPKEDVEPQLDKAAELQKVWGVQVGDVWELGQHRLVCGDCTDRATVEAVMRGERAAFCFTDPPYGVKYKGGTKKWAMLENDDEVNMYAAALPIICEFTEPKAALYLAFADANARSVYNSLTDNRYIQRALIIWNKNQAQFGALGAQYHQKHEPIAYCFKVGQSPYWFGPTNEVTVWDIDRSMANEYHPTQKPVELYERAMNNSSPGECVVLEPFLGSGTSIIACERLGRRCRGIEIDPSFCSVVLERWSQLTGQTPRRVPQGDTKRYERVA